MTSKARTLALLATVAIALAACGGGDDDAAPPSAETTPATTAPAPAAPPTTTGEVASDEQLVRSAIEAALTSRDPAVACERSTTEAYVQAAYGDRAGCEAAIASPGGAARSVQVSEVAVAGTGATAVAVPSGGPSNGERLDVALVREGDAWKLDSLRSNVPVGP